jgi:hypothetical protein
MRLTQGRRGLRLAVRLVYPCAKDAYEPYVEKMGLQELWSGEAKGNVKQRLIRSPSTPSTVRMERSL